MTISKSNAVLLMLLAVTLGLVWHASTLEEAGALPNKILANNLPKNAKTIGKTQANANTNANQTATYTLALSQRALLNPIDNLFASDSPHIEQTRVIEKKLYVPQLPLPAPQKQVPLTPPLPFKYLGRWADGAAEVYSLEYQGEVILLKQGEDYANYRLISAEAGLSGMSLKFLYLPLNEFQTLNIQTPS